MTSSELTSTATRQPSGASVLRVKNVCSTISWISTYQWRSTSAYHSPGQFLAAGHHIALQRRMLCFMSCKMGEITSKETTVCKLDQHCRNASVKNVFWWPKGSNSLNISHVLALSVPHVWPCYRSLSLPSLANVVVDKTLICVCQNFQSAETRWCNGRYSDGGIPYGTVGWWQKQRDTEAPSGTVGASWQQYHRSACVSDYWQFVNNFARIKLRVSLSSLPKIHTELFVFIQMDRWPGAKISSSPSEGCSFGNHRIADK